MTYGQTIYVSLLCLTPLIVFIGLIIFNDDFRNGILFTTKWIHRKDITLHYTEHRWETFGFFVGAYLQIFILAGIMLGLILLHIYIWNIL